MPYPFLGKFRFLDNPRLFALGFLGVFFSAGGEVS
jgi:hypothetical protein